MKKYWIDANLTHSQSPEGDVLSGWFSVKNAF